MVKLFLALHVLLAIFLVGPLAMIPMTALRSIRRRDAGQLHSAARQTMIYGLASIAVFLLGFAVVGTEPSSHRISLGAPWLTISMTLYVIALVLVLTVLVPSLRRAARLIDKGVLNPKTALATHTVTAVEGEQPAAGGATTEVEPTLTATAADLAGKERLDALYGRTAGIAGLVTLLFAVIIVLMVTRPFGN
jgi:uncharacterized membrane protein